MASINKDGSPRKPRGKARETVPLTEPGDVPAQAATQAKKPGKNSSVSDILQAAEFVSVGNRPLISSVPKLIVIHEGWLFAFDDRTGAGCPAAVPGISVAADATLLIKALKNCGANATIVMEGEDKLRIKSGSFSGVVPCVHISEVAYRAPDPNIAPIDTRITAGFSALHHIIKDDASLAISATLRLQHSVMHATNGGLLLEYWHGCALPPDLILPKPFIEAVVKAKKALVGFGYTENSSVTFYFEDGSWIKTQMNVTGWVDVAHILTNYGQNSKKLPDDFFSGVKSIAPFAQGPAVYLWPGIISTHDDPSIGATFDMPTLDAETCLSIDAIGALDGHMTHADFDPANPSAVFFFGEMLRCAMARQVTNGYVAPTPETDSDEEHETFYETVQTPNPTAGMVANDVVHSVTDYGNPQWTVGDLENETLY